MAEKTTVNELSTLPGYEYKSFALWVAKATEAYFKDPDVKRRFREWKREQKRLEAERKLKEGEDDAAQTL